MSSTEPNKKITASFRVMGAQLDPDEVSALLEIKPDLCHRRGDPHFGKGGRQYSDFSEGLWSFRSDSATCGDVESHVEDITKRLNGRGDSIRRLLAAGLRAEIFIGVIGIVGNYGFSLRSDIVKAIGELGLEIDFDLYNIDE